MAMVCRCLVERGLLWCCLFEHMVCCCCFCCSDNMFVVVVASQFSIFTLVWSFWFYILYLQRHPYVKVKNCDGTAPMVLRFHVFTHTITMMVLNPLCTTHSWGFLSFSIPMILFLHWYGPMFPLLSYIQHHPNVKVESLRWDTLHGSSFFFEFFTSSYGFTPSISPSPTPLRCLFSWGC